jgi:CheY-like chemotaxis protein
VDDLADAAAGLARLLKLLNCDVETAHDGPAAIARAQDFSPDIVLLDIGLPGMDGYGVAKELRARDCSAAALIVAVSGYGHQAARDQALAAGCNKHLLKPIGIAELEAILAERRKSLA